MIVVDWEETARFLLDDGEFEVCEGEVGGYYFRKYW
jgi:hypothetical protein